MIRTFSGRSSAAILSALLLLVVSSAIHYRIKTSFRADNSAFTPMLYLPSGKYLKAASFGYYGLLADFIYLWSIQYYGDPRFHPQVQYLKHTYDIITELDPQFIDAYQTGSLFLFSEGKDPEAGLRLLDKGLESNPKEWVLPTSAGFFCYMSLKDKKRSLQYFQKAAAVPGAPSLVKRMQAGLFFRLGEKRVAYQIWREVYETEKRPVVKQAAYQNMHDLKVLIDLEDLRNAIAKFITKHGSNPRNLEQLMQSGFIDKIPFDPEGNSYLYDPATGAPGYSKKLGLVQRYQ